jgi:hypothetical protein
MGFLDRAKDLFAPRCPGCGERLLHLVAGMIFDHAPDPKAPTRSCLVEMYYECSGCEERHVQRKFPGNATSWARPTDAAWQLAEACAEHGRAK